jgi:hypothetical protein
MKTKTDWLFELDGEAADLMALRPLATAFDCTVRPGPDTQLWLGGARFDGIVSIEDALAEAQRALDVLNGLARLESGKHGPVGLADAVLRDGRQERFSQPGKSPPRSRVYISQPPVLGAELATGPPIEDAIAQRRVRIANDPLLAEVLRALAGELSWQKLRFAFEKIRSLAGGNDNALVKRRYASQDELSRFKANIEDPRLSGIDAVHGVSKGPLKGSKMDESEGFDFVVRLLRQYVDENEIRESTGSVSAAERVIKEWLSVAEGPLRQRCENLAEFDALIAAHRARLAAMKAGA